jgi:hypothetical protein
MRRLAEATDQALKRTCRVRCLAFIIMLLCASGPALAQYAAAPPAKAEQGGPLAPPIPSGCQMRLSAIAVFKAVPALAGPGGCGALDAVLLENVILSDRTQVAVAPPATLRCEMAEAVAIWLREDVAPAVLKLGAALRGLDNFDSYECRSRNRVPGAVLSEHGRANALDVRAFKLSNGQVIGLTEVNVAKEWREAMRVNTCARFSTVLGPGSDGYHEEHVHLDLAERRGGYKMCEWDVREPFKQPETAEAKAERHAAELERTVPLPRPRPHAVASAPFDIRPRSQKARALLR